MPVKDPKEVFLLLLSNVRQGAERGAKIYQELGQLSQDPDIKEALEARAFIADQAVAKLDRCFELIGEKPMKTTGRIQEVFVEDFRKGLAEGDEVALTGEAPLQEGMQVRSNGG